MNSRELIPGLNDLVCYYIRCSLFIDLLKVDRKTQRKVIMALVATSRDWRAAMLAPMDAEIKVKHKEGERSLENLRIELYLAAGLFAVSNEEAKIYYVVCNVIAQGTRRKLSNEDGIDSEFKCFSTEEKARLYSASKPNTLMGWSLAPLSVVPKKVVREHAVCKAGYDSQSDEMFLIVKNDDLRTPSRNHSFYGSRTPTRPSSRIDDASPPSSPRLKQQVFP